MIKQTLICVCLWIFATSAQASNILVLGDSLSAGYGIDSDKAWPVLLQQHLDQQKTSGSDGYNVINASISGEVTAGGVARISKLLAKHKPSITVIELGANDGLRGLSLKQMRLNLSTMIEKAQAAESKVLLIGNQLPPNYGAAFTRLFFDTYPTLAKKHNVALVPFMLEKVALNDSMMQEDGLHPKANAQPLILETILPKLEPLL